MAAMKIIGATLTIAAACIDPVAADAGADRIGTAVGSFVQIAQSGANIAEDFGGIGGFCFDADTTMPPLPTTGSGLTDVQVEYNGDSADWYLSAQKNLSDSLVSLSPAFWDSIYIENYKNCEPIIQSPPSCGKYGGEIQTALLDYLANVKNVS